MARSSDQQYITGWGFSKHVSPRDPLLAHNSDPNVKVNSKTLYVRKIISFRILKNFIDFDF